MNTEGDRARRLAGMPRPGTDAVVVVGAGPAGSIAALVLARAGVRVVLVERARFPRAKLCGDTLNPGALSILDRFRLGASVRDESRPFTGMLVTGPGGAAVCGDYPAGVAGAALERSALDRLLLTAAADAGADVMEGVRVLAPAGDSAHVVGVRAAQGSRQFDIRARLVIAADGRPSGLAASLGLARFAVRPKRWAFGTYFADVAGLTTRGEMHIREDGYIGVAPLECGLANVCVVRDTPKGSETARDPADVVAQAIARHDTLRERFSGARRVAPVKVLGPLAIETTAAGQPGLLLAGDAAGFIDPMTGDGLRFALRGGELAAAAALRELETGFPAHALLAAERRREFGGKWRLNRALRFLVGWPSGLRLVASLSTWWPAPVSCLVRTAGDVHLAHAAS